MKQKLLSLICLCLFASLSAAPVWDTPTPVLRGDNIMWNRCSAVTNDGGVIYVWSDSHRGSRDIYAQKLDSSGNAVWNQPLLVAGNEWYEINPVITRSSDGNFIIVYTEHRGYADNRIKAQKITNNGVLYWQSEGVMVCMHDQDYYEYEVAADLGGGAFVVWEDVRTNVRGIYAQRINGSGVIQWAVNGIPFGDYNGSIYNFTATSDGSGGMFLLYAIQYSAQSAVCIKRIQSNGSLMLTQILETFYGYTNYDINLSQRLDDSVIATWNNNYTDASIKAQRVSLTGSLVWGSPIVVRQGSSSVTPYSAPQNHRIVSAGNNVIIAWKDGFTQKIYTQKLDLSGNLLWNPDGLQICTADGEQTNFRITSDNSGSVNIIWVDGRAETSNIYQLYSQYINSSGILIWPADGVYVTTIQRPYSNPLPRFSGDKFYLLWDDARPGCAGLFCQVLNQAGMPLLTPGGNLLNQGIETYSRPDIVVPRQNGVAVVWEDSRFNLSGNRIYIQYVNADGSAAFETNGKPVTLSTVDGQYYPAAATAPDGSVVVIWKEGDESIKGQKFDSIGNRLWGDEGMLIAEASQFILNNLVLSYYQNAFHIAYSKLVTLSPPYNQQLMHLYGQKIQGNQIAWDSDGVLISDYGQGDPMFEARPSSIVEDYYIWEKTNLNSDHYGERTVFAKRINPDGSTAVGWPESGIALSDYQNWDNIQYNSQAVLTDAGLAVVWIDYRIDFIASIYGQLISPSGDLLWNPEGVEMFPTAFEQQDVRLAYHNGITLIWRQIEETNPDNCSIKMQKYDLSGQPLWGENGVDIAPMDTVYDYDEPALALFPNGGMLAIFYRQHYDWHQDSKGLMYRYINPDGTMAYEAITFTDGYDETYSHKIIVTNNEAYAVWQETDMYSSQDGRCEDTYPATYMINAQKFSSPVGLDSDDLIPFSGLVLEQNYPNPFNPLTSIGFSLKKPSDATLSIYNLKGQKVKTLQKGWLDKGRHTLVWDGNDDRGNPCSSGIYYYRLNASGESRTQKMLLLK